MNKVLEKFQSKKNKSKPREADGVSEQLVIPQDFHKVTIKNELGEKKNSISAPPCQSCKRYISFNT